METPEELLECFEQEEKSINDTFMSFTEGQRKAYIDWIYNAKTDETKANRIAEMMERLSKGKRYGG